MAVFFYTMYNFIGSSRGDNLSAVIEPQKNLLMRDHWPLLQMKCGLERIMKHKIKSYHLVAA